MSSGMVQGSQSQQQEKKNERGGAADASRLKIVQRLLAAGDNLPAFLQDLLNTQAMVVAGTEAAAFMIDRQQDGFKLVPVVHMRPDQANDEIRKKAIEAFIQIVSPCVEQNREGAFEVGEADDSGETQYCLATVLRADAQAVGVTAVITRARGLDRARQRLASMELVAGYFEIYHMRRGSEQAKQVATSHQGVLQLIGAIATVDGFDSACKNICNELATRTGAARVAIGWVKGKEHKGKTVKVIALSHTDKFDKRQELLTSMKNVMEECLDQDQIVHYDPAGGGTDTVSREATAYSRQNGNCALVSVPLRRMNEVVGVLTLEYAADRKPDQNAATMVSLTGDVLTPQLYDRYQNDRNIFVKIGHSIKSFGEKSLGEKYMLAKIITAAVIITLAVLIFYKPTYKVSAPFTFASVDRRTIVAPAPAFIGEVGKIDGQVVRPGLRVKKGDVLVTMQTTELELKKVEAEARAIAAQKEADNKRKEGKIPEAVIAEKQRDAALAEVSLLDWQIKQAEIKAPMDGEILRGDLRDRRGAPVKEGEPLFEIGSVASLEVEANVKDKDIQYIKVGQDGVVATNSDPGSTWSFKVTRIVPLGEPKDANNVFRVYGELQDKDVPAWKPGMTGEAKIHTEPARLIWIWTHPLTDWIRLKMWSLGLWF